MNKFALTAELLLRAPANLMQTVRTVRNAFKDIDVNVKVKTDVRALQGIENDLKRLRDAGKQTSQFYNEIGGILANATRRFAGISIATGTFLGLARAIKNGIGDAIVFEREMAKIAQATDTSLHATKQLAEEIGNIGRQYGVASDELVKFARNFAQAGFNAKQTSAALELLAKTEAIGTFGTMENTMEGIITTLSVFSKEIKGSAADIDFMNKSFDAINKVSKRYAIESEDIITAIRRTGSTFKEAGGSINELMAIMTSIRSTTRESSDTIANGLKTILTRLQRGETTDALKELGVELVDLEGKFVKPMEAFSRLNMALKNFQGGSQRKANILEKIGGTYQIGRLIPAIKNTALQQQALNDANSAGGDINKDYAITQETLSNKITKTKEAFTSLVREITLSDGFKTGINVVLGYANAFIRVADSLKGLLPLLGVWVAMSAAKASVGFITSFSGGKVKPAKTGAGRVLAGNQVGGYATGGFVSGAPGIDKNPAMLTDGEFVVNRKDAQKNKGLLAAINSGRKVRMLAKGGSVGGGSGGPGGSQDFSAIINQFTHELKNLVKIMGPDAAKLEEALGNDLQVHDINKDPQGKSITERAQKEGFKGVNGSYSGQNKKIIINPATATSDTVRHELGHAADRSGIKGSIPNTGMGPQLPSQISGTINNIIAKAATQKNVEISKSRGEDEKFNKYRARPEEAFADLFKRAEPEGRALLVNLSSASTDAKKVDEALKKLATSIQTGQVSFDQVTDANILHVARTRGVIQAPSNINSATKSSAPPFSTSGFIPLSSVTDSAKNKARDQARIKREEAERIKEQFGGMKSSSSKFSGGDLGIKKDEESARSVDRTGIALFTLVSGITYLSESVSSFDDTTKKAIQSGAAFGAVFYSIAKSSIPYFAQVATSATKILDNFKNIVSGSSKTVASGLKAVEVSSLAAATSENVETASNVKAAKANSSSVGGLSAAVSGFTIGLSIAVGMIEYFSSKLRDSASALDKEAEKELSTFSDMGVGSSASIKQKMMEAQRKRNSASSGSNYGWGGAIAGGLAGAGAGAAAGAPFAGVGAIPGAAIGGFVGGVAGAVGIGYAGNAVGARAGDTLSEKENAQIQKSVDVQYESIKAVSSFAKALMESEKSYVDAGKKFEILKSASSTMSKDVEKVNKSFASLSSDLLKEKSTWFSGKVKPKIEDLTSEERNLYSNAEERKNQVSKEARIASTEVYNSAINKVISKSRLTSDQGEIKELFKSKDITEGINEATKLFAQTVNMQSEEGYKSFLEYRKSLVEDASKTESAAIKQASVQANAIIAREAEIKLIMELNSQFDSLAQSTLDLENFQKSIDIRSGSSSGGVDPKRFSDVSRVGNMSNFESDVNATAKNMGAGGQKIAKEYISTAKVIEQFRKNVQLDELNNIDRSGINTTEGESRVRTYLEKMAPDFKNINQEQQKSQIAYVQDLLGGGKITFEKLKDILSKFAGDAKPFGEVLQQSASNTKIMIDRLKDLNSELFNSSEKLGELKGGLSGVEETGRSRMFQAGKYSATDRDIEMDSSYREASRINIANDKLHGSGVTVGDTNINNLNNDIIRQKGLIEEKNRIDKLLSDNPQKTGFTQNFLNGFGLMSPQKRSRDALQQESIGLGRGIDESNKAMQATKLGNVGNLGSFLTSSKNKLIANEKRLGGNLSGPERSALTTENQKLDRAIKATTEELMRLANQSDRASDVMSKIEMEQGRKDFMKGKVSDFVLGGAEDRMSMQEQFKGLQNVMNTGTFQNLPEDLRKSVDGLIQETARFDPNNKFVKAAENAKVNDFKRMGGVLSPEQEIVMRGGMTPKEAAARKELADINAVEMAAQKALITAEENNTKAINDLINVFKAGAGAGLNPLPNLGGQGQNGQLATFETLNKTLETTVNRIPESMSTFSTSLNVVTASLDGIAQSLSNITMKHEVNIGGQLSVAGFNMEKVGEAIKDSLGEYISIAVQDAINKQNNSFRTA